MDIIIQGKLTKCQIINKILEYEPDYPKCKLWNKYNETLIKILNKLVERNEKKE